MFVCYRIDLRVGVAFDRYSLVDIVDVFDVTTYRSLEKADLEKA